VVTATAILKLVSKKIIFNQKVNTILKEFPYPDVTVRTLLTQAECGIMPISQKKRSLGPTQNLSGHIDYYGH
jgi:hypothetical protein